MGQGRECCRLTTEPLCLRTISQSASRSTSYDAAACVSVSECVTTNCEYCHCLSRRLKQLQNLSRLIFNRTVIASMHERNVRLRPCRPSAAGERVT